MYRDNPNFPLVDRDKWGNNTSFLGVQKIRINTYSGRTIRIGDFAIENAYTGTAIQYTDVPYRTIASEGLDWHWDVRKRDFLNPIYKYRNIRKFLYLAWDGGINSNTAFSLIPSSSSSELRFKLQDFLDTSGDPHNYDGAELIYKYGDTLFDSSRMNIKIYVVRTDATESIIYNKDIDTIEFTEVTNDYNITRSIYSENLQYIPTSQIQNFYAIVSPIGGLGVPIFFIITGCTVDNI